MDVTICIPEKYLFNHGGVDAAATRRYACSGGLQAAIVGANTSGLNRYPEKISAPLPKGSGAQKGFRELLQLGEVLDGANHLAHVAVLVVVPGHDLNLALAALELADHGLGGIEEGAEAHAETREPYRMPTISEETIWSSG